MVLVRNRARNVRNISLAPFCRSSCPSSPMSFLRRSPRIHPTLRGSSPTTTSQHTAGVYHVLVTSMKFIKLDRIFSVASRFVLHFVPPPGLVWTLDCLDIVKRGRTVPLPKNMLRIYVFIGSCGYFCGRVLPVFCFHSLSSPLPPRRILCGVDASIQLSSVISRGMRCQMSSALVREWTAFILFSAQFFCRSP